MQDHWQLIWKTTYEPHPSFLPGGDGSGWREAHFIDQYPSTGLESRSELLENFYRVLVRPIVQNHPQIVDVSILDGLVLEEVVSYECNPVRTRECRRQIFYRIGNDLWQVLHNHSKIGDSFGELEGYETVRSADIHNARAVMGLPIRSFCQYDLDDSLDWRERTSLPL